MSGFFSFFSSSPSTKKKKTGGRQLLPSTGGQILSTCLQIDMLEENISGLKQEEGVFGGGTTRDRWAGGTGMNGTKNKMESSCLFPREPRFDLRPKKKKTVLFEGKFFAVGTFRRGHQPVSASTSKARTPSSCPTAPASLVKTIKTTHRWLFELSPSLSTVSDQSARPDL